MFGDLVELRFVDLDPRLLAGVGDAEGGLVALGERLLAALGLEEEVVQDFGIVQRVARLAGLAAERLGEGHHDRLVPEGPAEPDGRRRCR